MCHGMRVMQSHRVSFSVAAEKSDETPVLSCFIEALSLFDFIPFTFSLFDAIHPSELDASSFVKFCLFRGESMLPKYFLYFYDPTRWGLCLTGTAFYGGKRRFVLWLRRETWGRLTSFDYLHFCKMCFFMIGMRIPTAIDGGFNLPLFLGFGLRVDC